MKEFILLFLTLVPFSLHPIQENGIADKSSYLADVKEELEKEWPKNRTINLVFHGHSVPSGYFKTPVVNTLEAYPYQLLSKLKEQYPYAVINIINTAIGGESSVSGAERFDSEVLNHNPDVLLIDYSLNDRGPGLEKAQLAWEEMIEKALKNDIKILLLTPSPDQRVNILDEESELEQHRNQVINLAKKHGLGLVDSYQLFKEEVKEGNPISDYMSQVNHPNSKGHQLIASEIFEYFK